MRLLTVLALILVVTPGTLLPVAAAQQVENCTVEGAEFQCETTVVQMREIIPGYSNGLEGNVDSTNFTGPQYTWPTLFNGSPMMEGVRIGAFFETLGRIYPALNGTAQPNGTRPVAYMTHEGRPEWPEGVTQLYEARVEFNATDIMNGASGFYYRSPIVWDSDNYTQIFLEITEAGTSRRSVSRFYNASGFDNWQAQLVGDRIIYNVSAEIKSNTEYRLREYVRVAGSPQPGVDHFDAYLAPDQDILGDGFVGFTAFPYEQVASSIDLDLALAFTFYYGMGPGGTMNLVRGAFDADVDGLGYWEVQEHDDAAVKNIHIPMLARSNGATSTSEQITLNVPLRTTHPLNVTIFAACIECAGQTSVVTRNGVTGSLHEQLALATPTNTSGDHLWLVALTVEFDNSTAPAETPAFSYPMYQSHNASDPDMPFFHVLRYRDGSNNDLAAVLHEWAAWAEVTETDTASALTITFSPSAQGILLSLALISAGLLVFGFLFVTAPVSILMVAVIGTAGGFLTVTGLEVLFHAVVDGEDGRARLEGNVEVALGLLRDGANFVGAAACGGAYFVPGVVNKLALGSVCALWGVGFPNLLRILLEIPEIIKTAVEKVGMFLAFFLENFWWILLGVAVFLSPYLFFIVIKYPLLMVLGPIAGLMGYERASRMPLFNRVYNFYMFGWTELVENRILRMGVQR